MRTPLRARLGLWLLLSALGHAALFWAFARHPLPQPPPPRGAVIELEVRSAPPPPPEPSPVASTPPAAPPRRRATSAPSAKGAPPPPPAGTPDARPSQDRPAADAPTAQGAAPATPLAPWQAQPLGGIRGGVPIASPGQTLHPGDPGLSREERLAQERARVGGRVDGFLDDSFAQVRTENGLAHPYVYELGRQLEATLGRADGGSAAQLGVTDAAAQMKQNYAKARANYGRTGHAGFAESINPSLSEKLRDMGQNGQPSAPMPLRALVQAKDTQLALQTMAPLLSLELEVLQGLSGEVEQARVLQKSGNRAFDAFVLRVAPKTIAALGPVPPEAIHTKTQKLRTLWRVDGWLRAEQPVADALAYQGVPLSALEQIGIPVSELDALAGTKSLRFDYRVHLLRAY